MNDLGDLGFLYLMWLPRVGWKIGHSTRGLADRLDAARTTNPKATYQRVFRLSHARKRELEFHTFLRRNLRGDPEYRLHIGPGREVYPNTPRVVGLIERWIFQARIGISEWSQRSIDQQIEGENSLRRAARGGRTRSAPRVRSNLIGQFEMDLRRR